MLNGLRYLVRDAWPIIPQILIQNNIFFLISSFFHPNQEGYEFDCYKLKEVS
jgi:hypothetical protein